ncbi:hypothetical protein N7510_003132 [Penicillium lagena]|uniref:uncharacterized protein n=1 Tax=Penicillium lagena TaxID=94218 RepID=UPI0025425227|nr:uncharacterized protein N7510_003132 [Penicillium lagena]KAJ5619148.1 hypothetical protein N7510_003132 [Penicillium lagena]
MAVLAADAPENMAGADDGALHIPVDLFPFPTPSLDLTQDWSWLHQNSLPAFPGNSDQVGHIDGEHAVPGLSSLNDDWIYPVPYQDFYVSQQVHEFLTTMGPVVESGRDFTAQRTGLLLNNAFQFIMESLPIFHQPTFNFEVIQRELCVSIFCVGQVRAELLQHVNKKTIYLADMEILQAMLLVEFSGMYLADRTAMELSDIFHGTLVTLSRRLGIFEISYNNSRAASLSTEGSNRQGLVEYETVKRVAYSVFALDVEHALFFGHDRSILSFYPMKLDLPSDNVGLRTPGHSEPLRQHETVHQPKFHHICQALLCTAEGHTLLPLNLNQLSNLLILLGVASIVLDLLQRRQDPFFDTKQALSHLSSVLPAINNRLISGPEGSTKVRGRALYHITVIALCTPLDDLERAANDGFSRTGRTPKQHTRAAIIRLLTKHKVGPKPARHALQLLKLFLLPLANSDLLSGQQCERYFGPSHSQPMAGYSPYEPSALYFGALTLWGYITCQISLDDDGDVRPQRNSYLPDANLNSPQTTSLRCSARAPVAEILQGMESAIDRDDSQACRSYWCILVQLVTDTLSRRWSNNAQEYSHVLSSLSENLSL